MTAKYQALVPSPYLEDRDAIKAKLEAADPNCEVIFIASIQSTCDALAMREGFKSYREYCKHHGIEP